MEGDNNYYLFPQNGGGFKPSPFQFLHGEGFMYNPGMSINPETPSTPSHRLSGGWGGSVESHSPRTPPNGFQFDFPQQWNSYEPTQPSYGPMVECTMPESSPYEPSPSSQSFQENPPPQLSQRVPLSQFNRSPKFKYSFCVFCKNNGEDEAYYLGHTVKDDKGFTSCPVLRAYTCPLCGASGPVAHTIRYCPRMKNNEQPPLGYATITELKQLRSSVGIIGGASRQNLPPSMRQFRGPNAAWTGPTTQPFPVPGTLDIFDRLDQENNNRLYNLPQLH